MRQLSCKRHRFPPKLIRHSIWLYARFTLIFRDVEEMLAERGLDVSYETVRRWFLRFGSIIAANLCRARPRPSDHWHLDEMVIVIRRRRYWLWRAVDNEGEVLDCPFYLFDPGLIESGADFLGRLVQPGHLWSAASERRNDCQYMNASDVPCGGQWAAS
jgi:hypothetical protein